MRAKDVPLSNSNPPLLTPLFALLPAVLGQWFLYSVHSLIPGLVLLLSGALLFSISARNIARIPEPMDKKQEILLFFAILLASAFFRLYKIDTIPAGCFVDEAQNCFEAMSILTGSLPVYTGFSTHNASLFLYPVAVVFKLFGAGVTQLRVTTAVIGILTVPAFYFLLRALSGARVAVIGGFLLAILRWHVNFNRIGYHASLGLLVFVLFLYFLIKSYRDGKWTYFILLGVTLGLSQHTYQPARLIPFLLILITFIVFIRNRSFFTGNLTKIVASLCLALLVALPVINYAVKNHDVFFQRQNEVNIFTEGVLAQTAGYDAKYASYTPGKLMLANIKDTLLMFNYSGDRNPKHNIPGRPVLDLLTGLFALLGFVYALLRIRSSLPCFLFMSIFAIFIVPGFITIEAPQSLRLYFLIPAVIFFAALFLERLMVLTSGVLLKKSAAAVVVILLAAACYSNYSLYFNKQAQNPYCWQDFSTDAWVTGQYCRDKGPGWTPVLAMEEYKKRTFNLAHTGKNEDSFRAFHIDQSVPAVYGDNENYCYILPPQYKSLIYPLFKALYPHGRYIPFHNKYNGDWLMYFAYEVDSSDAVAARNALAKNGLTLRRYPRPNWTGKTVSIKTSPVVFLDPDYGSISYEWTGKIKAPKSGSYVFILDSKGYSELYINKSKRLANEGGLKGAGPSKTVIELNAGYHDIRVRYSQSNAFAGFELRWVPPDGAEELVPYTCLFH
ncbi:MAG: glycosyltransferase family 39 protein [Spirochaetia bacterium]|nr:glycosyltransferase family 39 protein [Spirochaetia bacterium]